MLVLTRKKDEKIIIGDNIKITVVEIENGQVQLGIEAPDEVEIHREEVYRRIEQENIKAAGEKAIGLDQLKGLRLQRKQEDDVRRK